MEPCSHIVINEDNEDINIEQANMASKKVCAIHRRMQNLFSSQHFAIKVSKKNL